MTRIPRLLPLTAVAIGGVLALKAMTGAQALLSGGQAQAEEAPAASHHRPPVKTPAVPAAVEPATRPAAPVCAQSPTEIAKAAGLSPGELQTLQNLGARRGQLDDRERTLDTQLQLLAAAEGKVDAKMKALTALRGELKGLLGQADQQQQAEVDRLTSVYQKMKPRDAAAVMATLDDKVRIPVAAKMNDRALAAILAQMPTLEAKKLTESLAHRTTAMSLSQADEAPAAALLSDKPAAQTAAAADTTTPPPTGPKPASKKVAKSKPNASAAATS